MKLASWLDINRLSDAEFARRVGVPRQTIGRYKLGERFPKPNLLNKIYKATEGQVTANDFAGMPGKIRNSARN